ncbi:hypothetical protein [Mesorhizobium sp. 131-2-1]|uniref:hypothetical protein n=1 Tax=Mesorhizobium sp. 131-2-1 TaxID=2744518 RepID=UPI00192864B4|nr:hypothetical protein [Mesorhizobium sp. 131-2-1]BCG93233.1 hypothetical protein MesoLj131a_20970 [Mesorhizobium sp. 131-2-1]
MVLYAVLAICLLAAWHFHPVLFALLDAATSLWSATEIAGDARSKATGAPVPLADDMEAFRMDVAPSETGTTRFVGKPVQPSIRLTPAGETHQREK